MIPAWADGKDRVMSKRALRRHHKERMRAHVRRLLHRFWSDCINVTEEDIERWTRMRADNYTLCSCLMCRNPRRSRGFNPALTVQELRSNEDFLQQLLELK